MSPANPLIKRVRRAVHRGEMTADGFAVAEGFHLLEEAVESGSDIGAVIVRENVDQALKERVLAQMNGRGRVVAVQEAVFTDLAASETPQGVLALVRPPAWRLEQVMGRRALVVVLDGIQDPGNAGAILRASEAFGATGAAFLKGTVNPYNPKAMRASAGSVFRLPLVTGLDPNCLLAALEKRQIALYAAIPRAATPAAQANLAEPCAIVIGSEGGGVTADVRARAAAIRIPVTGVESLNAAVAAGVVLYEAHRQRSARS